MTEFTRHGLQRFRDGDYEGAAKIFTAQTGAEPDQPLGWNHLALTMTALGRPEEAAAALSRSLEIAPRQPEAWTSLASALLQLGHNTQALAAADAAIELSPDAAAGWQARALALSGLDDFAGAAEAFTRTLALEGESAGLCATLGAALLKCGRFHEAAASLARAAALDPAAPGVGEARRLAELAVAALDGAAPPVSGDDAEADRLCKTALLLLDAAGQRAAAARVAEAWAARRPDNIEARHLADAAHARPVDRQPAEMVARRFDEMAEAFDHVLVERLGYDGPGQLDALLAPHAWPEGGLDILDLGCGTGLCAPVLRPLARRLAGVDLSAGMLAKAHARGLYDVLERADLIDALAGGEGQWDLIAAMDAFPYLGDLGAVFAGAAGALRPGGWFAFSTERGQGDGFALNANGRYAHGGGYVRTLAAARFDVVSDVTTTLRREGGRAVDGGYYLLRLRD